MTDTHVISGFGAENGVSDASEESFPSHHPNAPARFEAGHYLPMYDQDWWWWWWINMYKAEIEDVSEEEEVVEKVKLETDLLVRANKLLHQTDKYGIPNLIIRRGDPFSMKVKVNREFNKTKDRLTLIFSTGPKPQASKGTLIRVVVDKEKMDLTKTSSTGWLSYIDKIETTSANSSEVTVKVRPAADSPVGKYKLVVSYFREVNGKEKKFSGKVDGIDEVIYILFNAFCKDDQVYLESDTERTEYVLNEKGRIFVGSAFWSYGRPWNFGQFSKSSLNAAMKALEDSKLDARAHGNPTRVCRALSSMVNKCGLTDEGILVGNWSGKYDGGESPTSWTGSPTILEQYLKTGKPVKYGQCWVFSGITTTLGRALGIPTRTVTNFDSAHDHDESMTIDKHFDEDGNPLTDKDDSIWNFHVWNESWFKRPDMPEGNDGWQAYDATPQELSEGAMQCGPASLTSIKEGNVFLNYDAKFIYAEVNGDELTWVVGKDEKMTLKEVKEGDGVGTKILTKAVGSSEENNITWLYKHKPKTPEEHAAKERAYGYSNLKKLEALEKQFEYSEKDVTMAYFSGVAENGDIKMDLKATNNSTEKRNLRLRVSCHTTYYTSIPAEQLSSEPINFVLEPGQTDTKTWTVAAQVYWHKVNEDAMVKLYVMATVKETAQMFTKIESFTFNKPKLEMQVSTETPKVGEPFTVTISFYNPLAVELREAALLIEGPGIQKLKKILIPNIQAYEQEIKQTVILTAKYPGDREIVCVFHSPQLVNMCGAVSVNVQEA